MANNCRRIQDGTVRTLVFAEIRTRDDTQEISAVPGHCRGRDRRSCRSTFIRLHRSATVTKDDRKVDDYSPWPGSLGYTQYSEQSTIPTCSMNAPIWSASNSIACLHVSNRFTHVISLAGYISSAPRSLHPGGVNVVYLDGHVGFLER